MGFLGYTHHFVCPSTPQDRVPFVLCVQISSPGPCCMPLSVCRAISVQKMNCSFDRIAGGGCSSQLRYDRCWLQRSNNHIQPPLYKPFNITAQVLDRLVATIILSALQCPCEHPWPSNIESLWRRHTQLDKHSTTRPYAFLCEVLRDMPPRASWARCCLARL